MDCTVIELASCMTELVLVTNLVREKFDLHRTCPDDLSIPQFVPLVHVYSWVCSSLAFQMVLL